MHFPSSYTKITCNRVGSSEDTFYSPLHVVPIVDHVYLMLTANTFYIVILQCWRYQFSTSGIQYYKFRAVFGIPRYLIKQNYTRKTVVSTCDNIRNYVQLQPVYKTVAVQHVIIWDSRARSVCSATSLTTLSHVLLKAYVLQRKIMM